MNSKYTDRQTTPRRFKTKFRENIKELREVVRFDSLPTAIDLDEFDLYLVDKP